jgi:hypothetical protein
MFRNVISCLRGLLLLLQEHGSYRLDSYEDVLTSMIQ